MFPIVLGFGGIVSELPENCGCRLLTLPNLSATFLPLFVRTPFAGFITLRFGSNPQAHGIDTPVGFLASYVDWAECISPTRVPWHFPIGDTLLDCVDNLVRHTCVNVPFVS